MGFALSHMQALGGNEGVEAMENVGFEGVTVTRKPVPLYVTPTFGYRELFAYMSKSTPADVSELWPLHKTYRILIPSAFVAVACLSNLTIDHASLSRRSTGPNTPSRDTSNILRYHCGFSMYYIETFCLSYPITVSPSVATVYLLG